MLPLFLSVDHRIDTSSRPFEERRVLRRSGPERLRFDLPATALPFVDLKDLPPVEPAPRRRALRVRVGLVLIACGQRLAAPALGP
ncbi:hypothetical protein [Rubellimicrobium arenae]|uniref:hypothetical protein n=1 Tax=Rubellimicrobium arenae TaxID=2817372 RepID=UPI001B301725|nr:hypothetical protein [Rubellimicrobium arenae]